MKLVIEIDENIYNALQTKEYEHYSISNIYRFINAIWNVIKHGTPLPKGHGDLVDVNTINLYEEDFYDGADYVRAINAITNAPTIIEADKEREE